MAHEAFDARDAAEGERRWIAAGRPPVPALVVDGAPHTILHVSQLAALLGLERAGSETPLRLAWDTVALLRAWRDGIAPLPFEDLLAPTRSRGRSLRNLTVNVCHPFELLPDAWETGRFEWDPERDAEREALLGDAAAVVAYADGTLRAWEAFVGLTADELATADRPVSSPRGDVAYSTVLDAQRWHAAFHYRQLLETIRVAAPLDVGRLAGLRLPDDVF